MFNITLIHSYKKFNAKIRLLIFSLILSSLFLLHNHKSVIVCYKRYRCVYELNIVTLKIYYLTNWEFLLLCFFLVFLHYWICWNLISARLGIKGTLFTRNNITLLVRGFGYSIGSKWFSWEFLYSFGWSYWSLWWLISNYRPCRILKTNLIT